MSEFRWIFTRLAPPVANTTQDVHVCGNGGVLTDELTAIQVPGGCWATVTAYNAVTIKDVDAKTQAVVVNKLKPILSCQ